METQTPKPDMPTLDPNPRNILGKGLIDPATDGGYTDEKLIAEGVVFAERIPIVPGKSFLLITVTRPWDEMMSNLAEQDKASYNALRKLVGLPVN